MSTHLCHARDAVAAVEVGEVFASHDPPARRTCRKRLLLAAGGITSHDQLTCAERKPLAVKKPMSF